VVWAVLNPAYTRLAMQQLAPESRTVPRSGEELVARMQNMIINVDASSGIEGSSRRCADRPEDANTLGQLLRRGGFLYKRYQAQKDNPESSAIARSGARDARGRSGLRCGCRSSDDQMDVAHSQKYLRAEDVRLRK